MRNSYSAVQLPPGVLHVIGSGSTGIKLLQAERILPDPILHQADICGHIPILIRQPVSLTELTHVSGPVQHDQPLQIIVVTIVPVDPIREAYRFRTSFHIPPVGKYERILAG
ncbi:hypothetical protein D3C81_1618140 [compost metagenome]